MSGRSTYDAAPGPGRAPSPWSGRSVRQGKRLPPMPWLLLALCSGAGVIAGVAFGFARGLDYPPTLPFALVEGGLLFGVPATVLGLLAVAVWYVADFLRGRPS